MKTAWVPGMPPTARRMVDTTRRMPLRSVYGSLTMAPMMGLSTRMTANMRSISGMARIRDSISLMIASFWSVLKPGGIFTTPKMKLRFPRGR